MLGVVLAATPGPVGDPPPPSQGPGPPGVGGGRHWPCSLPARGTRSAQQTHSLHVLPAALGETYVFRFLGPYLSADSCLTRTPEGPLPQTCMCGGGPRVFLRCGSDLGSHVGSIWDGAAGRGEAGTSLTWVLPAGQRCPAHLGRLRSVRGHCLLPRLRPAASARPGGPVSFGPGGRAMAQVQKGQAVNGGRAPW